MGSGPPPRIAAMSDACVRPRASRHHQALPGRRRQRPHRLRPPARRGARAARRERGRQVDADERPLRPLPRRTRARSGINGEPVDFHSPKEAIEHGIGMVHQHFMLIPVMTVAENIVLGDRARARRRPARLRRRAASASASWPRRSGSQSTRTRSIQDITVGQQQRVEILKALYRQRRHPHPRRADGGADAAGGERAVRDPPLRSRARGCRSSSSATS